MNNILKISDAATIGLHASIVLANNLNKLLSTHEIADMMSVSEAHLSKVLQRLAKAGYVHAVRGPKGGFKLAIDPTELTLLDIFEAIEGTLKESTCLFATPICDGKNCVLGDLLQDISHQVYTCLSGKKLSDIHNPAFIQPQE